jgi:siroheme synthase-like protein
MLFISGKQDFDGSSLMNYLPIHLALGERVCLVAGGGEVALQKARVLREAGGRVRVVAPEILPELAALEGVETVWREFVPEDLEGAALAVAATDRTGLNHRIAHLARRRGVPVNVVDDPKHCDFLFPSILRRGALTLAVSTGGASPSLARLIREGLEPAFAPGYGAAVARLKVMRRRTRAGIVCPGARRAIAETLARMTANARAGGAPDLAARMEALVAEAEALARVERENAEHARAARAATGAQR